MREFWTVVHRWLGLTAALFLIVAGATGAVISWDHEIDEWLNADIMETPGRGPLQNPLALAAAVEASDPRVEVSYMTLGLEEGHAASFLVRPKKDPATGKPYVLGYNNVFVDPVTAQVTGQRDSKSIALSKRNLMPWLRHLHESLHMPAFWGSDRWGFWLMGGIALMWLIDSFVALYLTLPRRLAEGRAQALSGAPKRSWWKRWQPSWIVRWRAGGYRLNFDLHRAGGLWVWAIIIVVSFTSFSLNLYREVFYPVMSKISTTTPGPYETITPAPMGSFIVPKISFEAAIDIARAEGERLGFEFPPGGIWYGGDFPFYNISFFDPTDEMGAMGMGMSNIYVSADNGEVLGTHRPWHGTAADVFVQLQLPLHSGRILGMTGRIMMSIMGVFVVMLSITGIVIWERKRRARKAMARTLAVGAAG
ncbi:PepSY-associated TM helix domain-containing protein [Comamonas endophytica]|uniref:PepSY domain-containing protein n=1 Tax=Comamonas endophytica TaxID=2949090 RepID=A0ABY6GEG7_9BURK|nr:MULTISPECIES: PepSY-associated TM helix domain-containing protein [unclassified Acidovorax]MCD2512906.1 PepSY domain-containing protein [Acidovorax sp. D4N7]UYG52747.1 PepSY domain-containing protein [Acidovorax sp. 5MLIR]